MEGTTKKISTAISASGFFPIRRSLWWEPTIAERAISLSPLTPGTHRAGTAAHSCATGEATDAADETRPDEGLGPKDGRRRRRGRGGSEQERRTTTACCARRYVTNEEWVCPPS